MGTITIKLNDKGEPIYVDIDGRSFTKPTHKLPEKTPPGVLKGIREIG